MSCSCFNTACAQADSQLARSTTAPQPSHSQLQPSLLKAQGKQSPAAGIQTSPKAAAQLPPSMGSTAQSLFRALIKRSSSKSAGQAVDPDSSAASTQQAQRSLPSHSSVPRPAASTSAASRQLASMTSAVELSALPAASSPQGQAGAAKLPKPEAGADNQAEWEAWGQQADGECASLHKQLEAEQQRSASLRQQSERWQHTAEDWQEESAVLRSQVEALQLGTSKVCLCWAKPSSLPSP